MTDTVLVTGANGFIGGHVIAALLGAGYQVRGTVRSEEKGSAALAALSAAGIDTSGLGIVVADLRSDAGWAAAADGCAAVFSIASPFPTVFPKNRTAVLPEARDGALHVLAAALEAGVPRFIHTSSAAATANRPDRPNPLPINEEDWSDATWRGCNAYVLSKTLAERALWERVERSDGAVEMVAINPGLVLGPLLDDHLDASMGMLAQLLRREFPSVANLAWPVVDVRDLASLQVAALQTPAAAGRRLIAAGDTLRQSEMVRLLRTEFPDRTTWPSATPAPDVLMRLLAWVIPAAAAMREDFGSVPIARSTYVTELTVCTSAPPGSADSGVWPNRSRYCLEGFLRRLRTRPASITTSCSYRFPSTSRTPKAITLACIGTSSRVGHSFGTRVAHEAARWHGGHEGWASP